MHDGDIDYSRYTERELEEALAGIDRTRYPRNFANLGAAYQALTSMPVPPPREKDLDVLDDEPAPPVPKYHADGRYLPNHIPVEDRVVHLVSAVFLFAYGSIGVWLNDLPLPGRRGILHLRDFGAWAMYAAIVSACLALLVLIADHYDRRDNEIRYWHAARMLRGLGWSCFGVSIIGAIVQSAAG
ncbi:hypothetical protein [Pseudoxanthomonas sp. PXM02]|uniref:hypothetical protein n=1 Tax=Pseudoxanthomonas sp. PXM02 TaxID=2769294 RepID=UPI00177E72CC|nr:hypothetical protein [Pseudoxanthomonas sp. PXM02]MBD9480563.1 hypothetical protein [Pseudoxanthomonas sp. PXM02]